MQQHSFTALYQTNQSTFPNKSTTRCAHCGALLSRGDPLVAGGGSEDLLNKSSDVILAVLLVRLGFLPDLLCPTTFLGTTQGEGFVLPLVNSVKDCEGVLPLFFADKLSQSPLSVFHWGFFQLLH